MTREQIDERIALCDELLSTIALCDANKIDERIALLLLSTTTEHDPIPYGKLAEIGLLTPYAGVSASNLHTAVEQRRREFVFMRELRDKWFL